MSQTSIFKSNKSKVEKTLQLVSFLFKFYFDVYQEGLFEMKSFVLPPPPNLYNMIADRDSNISKCANLKVQFFINYQVSHVCSYKSSLITSFVCTCLCS